MAKWGQGEAIVSFDDTSNALQNYSTAVTEVSLNVTRDNAQSGNLGSDYKDGFLGKISASGSITVYRDTTATSAYYMLKERLTNATHNGSAITLQIDEPDAANGSLRTSLEILITGMDRSSSGNSGDAATAVFNYISDGTITESVIST